VVQFTLNGERVETEVEDDTPLLWVVRDVFGLKSPKFGCGAGLCGACSMLVEGASTRTCILPVSGVAGKSVVTLEGLGTPDALHPLQEAWIEGSVPQCGYCQSGQIISAAALLADTPDPTDAEIAKAMTGNLCRCGTYGRIRSAIKLAASRMRPETGGAE